ncbi:hypothetical protein [Streptomyces jumonjinensis]|uniref:hypothetical protein n=1 Tax=Streptomyces jumonjinensis TaxID=1945 RepID=UPI0037A6D29B
MGRHRSVVWARRLVQASEKYRRSKRASASYATFGALQWQGGSLPNLVGEEPEVRYGLPGRLPKVAEAGVTADEGGHTEQKGLGRTPAPPFAHLRDENAHVTGAQETQVFVPGQVVVASGEADGVTAGGEDPDSGCCPQSFGDDLGTLPVHGLASIDSDLVLLQTEPALALGSFQSAYAVDLGHIEAVVDDPYVPDAVSSQETGPVRRYADDRPALVQDAEESTPEQGFDGP